MDDCIGPRPRPTAARPLRGLNLLLVEDSRFAAEAIRQFALFSGARLRQADCVHAARRHLASFAPSVVIVDLGLPDGSGLDLIASLSMGDGAMPILATSGDDAALSEAWSAGARATLAKPIPGLGAFQEAVLSCLPSDQRPIGPRLVSPAAPSGHDRALRDDLSHAATLLQGAPDLGTLRYVGAFLRGLGSCAQDRALATAAAAVEIDAAALPALRSVLTHRLTAG